MKRVARQNVWETNSSSMHTVTVRGKKNMIRYRFPTVIELWLGEYGWNGDPCYEFQTKLEYAMSMILHTEYPGFNQYDENFVVDQNILEGLDGYNKLIEAIRKHGECDAIIINRYNGDIYPYGYIDHQSYEDYNSLQDFLDYWNIDAERLLFDDAVVVWIDNDNHY